MIEHGRASGSSTRVAAESGQIRASVKIWVEGVVIGNEAIGSRTPTREFWLYARKSRGMSKIQRANTNGRSDDEQCVPVRGIVCAPALELRASLVARAAPASGSPAERSPGTRKLAD